VVGEGFAEGVAILLASELGKDGQDQGAARSSERRLSKMEESRVMYCVPSTVRRILCHAQYKLSRGIFIFLSFFFSYLAASGLEGYSGFPRLEQR
jgi:hypothetical protein